MNDRATQSRIRRLEMLTDGMVKSGYPIIISPTAPAFPTNKSIWIDSDDTTISFQYKEGNNAVWVSFGELSIENITDLADVDSTDIGVGKILQIAADGFTHEYVELLISSITGLTDALAGKQATLVSGTNIKTINGDSILDSGDITISGGGGLRRSETLYAPSYISYLAFAPQGSLETDAVWTITKRVGSADGTIISNVQYLLKKWSERNLL